MAKAIALHRTILATGLLLGLVACNKSDYFGPVSLDLDTPVTSGELTNRVLIGCEGNFQAGNASVSVYDKSTGVLSGGAFFQVNQRGLGDVLQSISRLGDTLVFVVNNSGEVIFCDAQSLQVIGTVSGLQSPRYALRIGRQLWVTDLYANALTVIDLEHLKVEKEVAINGWLERMAHHRDRVLLANLSERQVLYMEEGGEEPQTLLSLEFTPQFMAVTGDTLLLAGADGPIDQHPTHTRVRMVDLRDLDLVMDRTIDQPFANAAVNPLDPHLYVLCSEEVFAFDVRSLEVERFPHDAQTPYGFGFDPAASIHYVCDARDYISDGLVFRYTAGGSPVDSFSAEGYIPQSVLPLF